MAQIEDLSRFDATDELLERALDGLRVRALASEAERLFEKMLFKRKTCTFHTYSVAPRPVASKFPLSMRHA